MRSERGEIMERVECWLTQHGAQPGQRLPGERDLCAELGVSRTALRSAIQQLAAEGVLTCRANCGTFVAQPKICRPLQHYVPFKRTVEQAGRVFSTQVLAFETAECSKPVAAALHLVIGSPVYRLQRLRSIDGTPFMLDTSYLDPARFPQLPEHDFARQSLYTVLREEYGAAVRKGSEKLRITYALPEEAQQLRIAEGQALFYITGLALDARDVPVEYAKVVVRPEQVRFSSLLT